MNCQFCEQKPKLVTIPELTGEQLHSHDFDTDGKTFKICPNCFSCDNIGLRGERELTRNIILSHNQYSRRDKKLAVRILCRKVGLRGDERLIATAEATNLTIGKTDSESVEVLSSYFNQQQKRVSNLLYNAKVYRKLQGDNKYDRSFKKEKHSKIR